MVNNAFCALGGGRGAFLKGMPQAGRLRRRGERWWVQLFDFLSCSFEASTLNRKRKNNPLCQPFVAPSLLFPLKSKETDKIHFVQTAFVYFI